MQRIAQIDADVNSVKCTFGFPPKYCAHYAAKVAMKRGDVNLWRDMVTHHRDVFDDDEGIDQVAQQLQLVPMEKAESTYRLVVSMRSPWGTLVMKKTRSIARFVASKFQYSSAPPAERAIKLVATARLEIIDSLFPTLAQEIDADCPPTS